MSFAHPAVLLLLALPVILAAWDWQRRGHIVVLPFDHGDVPSHRRLERLVKSLQLTVPLLLALAILLLAGPQRLRVPKDTRVLTNVVFCLDVSGSMMSQFGDGTRSDKALAAIVDFTHKRKGGAFGLTAFGSGVLHWVPVTRDLDVIARAAAFLRPERMPSYMGGTLIGHAVREVEKLLVAAPVGDRMIILVSDGDSFDLSGGVAEQIGRDLVANHITLFYIHVAEGQPQEETAAMARMSGGQAFAADNPGALADVFHRIDAMKPAQLKPLAPVPVDFFWPFVVSALGCLVLQMASVLGLRFTPW
jgi:Ca-activated chloride channel family protein